MPEFDLLCHLSAQFSCRKPWISEYPLSKREIVLISRDRLRSKSRKSGASGMARPSLLLSLETARFSEMRIAPARLNHILEVKSTPIKASTEPEEDHSGLKLSRTASEFSDCLWFPVESSLEWSQSTGPYLLLCPSARHAIPKEA